VSTPDYPFMWRQDDEHETLVSDGREADAQPLDASMLVPFAESGATCVDCSGCFDGEDVGHKAPSGDHTSVYNRGAGSHNACMTTGLCDVKHPITYPDCSGAGEGLELMVALEEVRQAIAAGRVDEARRIAARDATDKVSYNESRHAIQVAACNGTLIAHLPLH
jgi:hypothetical protein